MFVFNKEDRSLERIIAKLDSAGRARVDAVRQSRIKSVESVKKASLKRGTHRDSHDRITDTMINAVVRREAKLQKMLLDKRNKEKEERRKLRLRVRFENSDEYKNQCRLHMERLFGRSML